ncbi:MAG: magnesium transporter [Alphaproteobacteria bacterium]|nr:magnesium transporter [Alphaproteobacteria bacterium]
MSSEAEAPTVAEDAALYGVSDELIRDAVAALDEEDLERIRAITEPLHAADVADLLEHLDPGHRNDLIDILKVDLDAEVLTYLDEHLREDVIERIGTADLAAAITELDSDDALDLIENLDEPERQEVLDAVPAGERIVLQQALTYPEKSAGRLMQRETVAAPENWTVGDTIDFARNAEQLPDDFYDLVVVDPAYRPVGTVPLSRLMRTKRPTSLSNLMDKSPHLIPITMDEEEVARLFQQYGLVSAPVIDSSGRLQGVITVDDVVDVLDEAHEDDLLKLGGVSEDDLYSAVSVTTRARFPWLSMNLLTAVAASLVIGLFEGTIAKITSLAVLMPIVASMGGNAGTQTLTVTVRALATREVTGANAYRLLGKELLVGFWNGLLFSVIIAGIAYFWFGNLGISAVIAGSTIMTLLVAGLSGAFIPLLLERLKVDPAVASGVFLTTVTDVIGFFTFLGLAAFFLV